MTDPKPTTPGVPGRSAPRVRRSWTALALAGLLSATCGPTAPPTLPVPVVTPEQRRGWILELEHQRVLREPAAGGAAGQPAAAASADLVALLGAPDRQLRRRAALAIGRVGLAEGVAPLVAALGDPEPEVRQMSAFALGLLGDRAAVDPLRDALNDPEPIVRGRAAEALGLIGASEAAPAIGAMVGSFIQQGVLGKVTADDETYPMAPPVEAVRLGVFALARLKAYEPLASAVLGRDGFPVTQWWPVAYAFSRVEDPRTLTILMHLATSGGRYTRAFAARGLGESKDRAALTTLVRLLDPDQAGAQVVASAVRAIGQIGGDAPPELLALLQRPDLDPGLRLEVITAFGSLRAPDAVDDVIDRLADPRPAMRAAALRTVARLDPDAFALVLSGLPQDSHWSVRAAMAAALAELPAAVALPRLRLLLNDDDRRVVPAALSALARLRAPEAEPTLLARLTDEDFVVRATAARELGVVKPPSGVKALIEAFRTGAGDATYLARAAALSALAGYGAAAAVPTLESALDDPEWAVRVRAIELLRELNPKGSYVDAGRPAPGLPRGITSFDEPFLVEPPFSPQLYIDTDQGTIQIELAVLEAPLTIRALTDLVRRGFFNGLAIHRVVPNFVVQIGDPRGDGEGGPGFTLRDELNQRPFLRGTVGMALDWADTGGSQFFITHSPQPHLDARYTVIGTVVGGMEVVDTLERWAIVRRVRVWDGVMQMER